MQRLYGEEDHRVYSRLQQAIQASIALRALSKDVHLPNQETRSSTSGNMCEHGYPSYSYRSDTAQKEEEFKVKQAYQMADDTSDHGSGKSTAMKRAYSIARNEARLNEVVVAFFFNARGVPMETRVEGFFYSVLHQLLQCPRLSSDEGLEAWKRKETSTRSGWKWTAKDLQNMFLASTLGSTVSLINARQMTVHPRRFYFCFRRGIAFRVAARRFHNTGILKVKFSGADL
ncbi:hypothetical protein PV08_02290 [Exophiala spinifera]|uniref:Nephrocystin 3-like N-terminal domain-containing protein n=1 Tax=Exophiala spinifera TaxID=91928 RepID=A0A0D2BGC7_9EURO|nr:uncharacterized protein PV08_02290 [Exophiala spinifera]KIW18003.1 hypothetical protein PV08_02290 [Exophiala spinifera]